MHPGRTSLGITPLWVPRSLFCTCEVWEVAWLPEQEMCDLCRVQPPPLIVSVHRKWLSNGFTPTLPGQGVRGICLLSQVLFPRQEHGLGIWGTQVPILVLSSSAVWCELPSVRINTPCRLVVKFKIIYQDTWNRVCEHPQIQVHTPCHMAGW